MNDNQEEKTPDITDVKNWNKAVPDEVPPPTYVSFFLAMGFAFLFWGIVAGWMIAGAGLLIVIISLTGWIKILRNEAGRRN